jgi:alkanesulfonate monooxygenase SsuD/methylene tetrahydromethanopterin reductase-like flavin-dependent oxidoreductase (luciferase family)
MQAGRSRLGLVLHNRGVVTGDTTVDELLALAAQAETANWDSVWVGDSILAKPRLEAIVLLSAIAARTRRIRIGPACMASTPLREPLLLAHQWASLDVLSGGRTVFAACQGQPGDTSGEFEREFATFGIEKDARRGRMEEAVEIIRLTSAQEHVSYKGRHFQFNDVTVQPRPLQRPLPILMVASPDMAKRRNVESAYRRVARLGDGWMTTLTSPPVIRNSIDLIKGFADEAGRPLPHDFDVCLYHSINVNDDQAVALADARQYLRDYYGTVFPDDYVRSRVALGTPQACIDRLSAFLDAGVTSIVLRLADVDQRRQFERVSESVLPALRIHQ